jgi:D-ribose pyranose/furanose isomerase RbsD
MYEDCLHEQEWSYGARFCPGGDANADYAHHLQFEAEAAAKASRVHQKLAIMIIQEPGVPAPDAMWRSKIAAMTATPEFRTICCAIVTRNALIRGVVTALNWIRKRDYQEAIFAESNSALTWLEKACGRPLPALQHTVRAWRTAACSRIPRSNTGEEIPKVTHPSTR